MRATEPSQLLLTLPNLTPYVRDGLAPWLFRAEQILPACLAGEPRYADHLGWLHSDQWAGEDVLSRLNALAETIRTRDEVFVLIGVGGSNNAARAVIESIGDRSGTKVLYAGNNLSAHAMNEVLERVKDCSFSVNLIAKNFETLEPGVAFRILRQELVRRYGAAANERIVATGTAGSALERLSAKEGYTFLPFPDDIGGRFSALSVVGLLPMAVAGVDIREVVSGAREMRAQLEAEQGAENPAVQYAAARNLLYHAGYRVELLASFEPRMRWFSKWWLQLFGESEGKDGKGIFPASAEYSEDLHAIGQYVQDGSRILFETMLNVADDPSACLIQPDALQDGFGYVDGMDLREMNRAAQAATAEAHSKVLPVLQFTIPRLDAKNYGALFYFFAFACYLSARLMEIHPFHQPGVEAYKTNLFRRLGKPGDSDNRDGR